MMKKKIWIAIIVTTVIIFIGLSIWNDRRPYQFRQDFDQIEKIEILKKNPSNQSGYHVPMTVLKTLDITEHRAFIDDLMQIEGGRDSFLDPITDFGVYIIRITYQDGEIELISEDNNGYIGVDGRVRSGPYFMDQEQFYEFLSRFLGEKISRDP